MPAVTEFAFTELLPLGPDETTYRLVSSEGIGSFTAGGHRFLTVEPEVLTELTSLAMHEIAHYLRSGHLNQLRTILDDPDASANDRFVALDLLKNACISAGGVLPMCQDYVGLGQRIGFNDLLIGFFLLRGKRDGNDSPGK